ncbi:lamin tail domain-containing protein [Paenibacillus mucilaginosus]|nr:lamin tail domain-containing protein [Paenibacillus caseinilyticus]
MGGGSSPLPGKPDRPGGKPSEPHGPLYIAGAVVRPADAAGSGQESVTLLNASTEPVALAGWSLANRSKQKHALEGTIAPGEFLTVRLGRAAGGQEFLRNKGDILTLLDPKGLKAHGVSYTEGQVREGWTLLF